MDSWREMLHYPVLCHGVGICSAHIHQFSYLPLILIPLPPLFCYLSFSQESARNKCGVFCQPQWWKSNFTMMYDLDVRASCVSVLWLCSSTSFRRNGHSTTPHCDRSYQRPKVLSKGFCVKVARGWCPSSGKGEIDFLRCYVLKTTVQPFNSPLFLSFGWVQMLSLVSFTVLRFFLLFAAHTWRRLGSSAWGSDVWDIQQCLSQVWVVFVWLNKCLRWCGLSVVVQRERSDVDINYGRDGMFLSFNPASEIHSPFRAKSWR